METLGFKICSKCGEVKYLSEYGKDKTVKSGIKAYCKHCGMQMTKKWLKNNPEKSKQYKQNAKPKIISDYYKKQHEKQKQNKCLICGCSLIGRTLLTKYCTSCKKEIKKKWKKDSYNKNIETYKEYNKVNRDKIRQYERDKNFKKRSELDKKYIEKLLVEKDGFNREFVQENTELIELKKIIIKTKRLCKTSQN